MLNNYYVAPMKILIKLIDVIMLESVATDPLHKDQLRNPGLIAPNLLL